MPDATSPSWDALYATTELQAGYFTTAQGAEAGYSPQLLYKHLEAGRIRRVRRGIYRLVHFPMSDEEHLAECWLWAEQAGVFSHETALSYHDIFDILPSTCTSRSRKRGVGVGSGCPRAWCSATGTSRMPTVPGSARSRSPNRRGPSATSSTPTSPPDPLSGPSPTPAAAASSSGTRPTNSKRGSARPRGAKRIAMRDVPKVSPPRRLDPFRLAATIGYRMFRYPRG